MADREGLVGVNELFHARGCGRIGTFGGYTVRFDPSQGLLLTCCGRVADGEFDEDPMRGFGDDDVLRARAPVQWHHVEHPEYAEADRQAEQYRLDAWVASIMAISDPRTRAAVSDSLTNHMVTYGRVP